jgi:hypothetical protein
MAGRDRISNDCLARWTSRILGVLNGAVSIYFADATLASAFVVRWCARSTVEAAGGVFRVRKDTLDRPANLRKQ